MSEEKTEHVTSLRSRQRATAASARDDDPATRERERRLAELRRQVEFWMRGKNRPSRDIEEEEETHEEILDSVTDLPDPSDDDVYLRYLRQRFDLEKVGRWVEAGFRAGRLGRDPEIESRPRRELPVTVDPHDLSEARWGLVCRRSDSEWLRARLAPLLERRSEQQGAEVRIFELEEHESAVEFLARHDHTAGVVDPEALPYYLAIAGSARDVSFEFQYQLGVDRAVGRLAFDAPSDYGRYALGVRKAEEEGSSLAPRATVFSVENQDDEIAPAIAEYISRPLFERLEGFPGWESDLVDGKEATKDRLRRLVSGGAESPGLLLVASHGLAVSRELKDGMVQSLFQGSVICREESEGDRIFAAVDVPQEADLAGQIAFLFACYGGGTPVLDNFPTEPMAKGDADAPPPRRVLAERAFVAQLPQKLLSRGALATVAHVDRGWLLSFVWSAGGRAIGSTASLEDTLLRLLLGDRLGHAFRPMQRRASSISFRLNQLLEHVRDGLPVDPAYLGELWLTANDARNLIILGDPAVYLRGERSSGDLLRLPKELTARLRAQALDHGRNLEEWVLAVLEDRLRRDEY